jgi:hypothetical protein
MVLSPSLRRNGSFDILRRSLKDNRFQVCRHPFLGLDPRPERVGKSPAELLTGQTHPHWLEMLGYRLFSRN